MNKLAVQRQSRLLLPELSELSQLVTGLPAFAGLRPFFDNHRMRLEDETKEGLYEVRADGGSRADRGRRGHCPRRPADDQRPCGHGPPNRTGSRSSRTGRSPERFHYPQAPTRTTSAPPTTGASSLFRSHCPTPSRRKSTSRCSRLPLTTTTSMTKTCTRTTTRTIRTIRPTRRLTSPKARISTGPTTEPDRLPSKGWKPPNSSPCCRDDGWPCSPVRGCPPIRASPTTADRTRRRAIR